MFAGFSTQRVIALAALTRRAAPGFGAYVTCSYLLIDGKPLILLRISRMTNETVSQPEAGDAEMGLFYTPNRRLIIAAGKLARAEQERLERQASRAAIPAPASHPIPASMGKRRRRA